MAFEGQLNVRRLQEVEHVNITLDIQQHMILINVLRYPEGEIVSICKDIKQTP